MHHWNMMVHLAMIHYNPCNKDSTKYWLAWVLSSKSLVLIQLRSNNNKYKIPCHNNIFKSTTYQSETARYYEVSLMQSIYWSISTMNPIYDVNQYDVSQVNVNRQLKTNYKYLEVTQNITIYYHYVPRKLWIKCMFCTSFTKSFLLFSKIMRIICFDDANFIDKRIDNVEKTFATT